MLIEFRVSNFRSFREEQTLSLVASKDKGHEDNLIPAGKFSLLKSAAIFGLNASGKSNLIKAIEVMKDFVEKSATTMNIGDKIPGIVPFRLDRESRAQPSTFELTATIGSTRFSYGFSATSERVHDEWLTVWPPGGKVQDWVQRHLDLTVGKTLWSFGGPLKAHAEMLRERTRDNGLVLSRGAELNMGDFEKLFLGIRYGLMVLDLSGDPTWLTQATATLAKDDRRLVEFVTQLLRHADLGIDSIRLGEEAYQDASAHTQDGARPPSHIPIRSLHRSGSAGETEEFGFEEAESNGTQRLFGLGSVLLAALDAGGTIVVDELDCSMHPLLTRKVIELFQSPAHNTKGAQLIFATHDSTLMDPELFRRDQIWLTEKNQNGATQLFSLHDFEGENRPRSSEAFQRNYLAGRYGAVPKFGPLFENLEPQPE